MPRQTSPSNAWCFTLNNYTSEEYEFLSSLVFKESEKYFFIIGKEVGESGTPHLQGYVALKEKSKKFRPLPKFAVLRKERNAMHFERARGSRQQNYIYCSKDGKFITNIKESQTLTMSEVMKDLKRQIQDLNSRIDETFDMVGVEDAESYEIAYEMCAFWLEKREKLLQRWINYEADPENGFLDEII